MRFMSVAFVGLLACSWAQSQPVSVSDRYQPQTQQSKGNPKDAKTPATHVIKVNAANEYRKPDQNKNQSGNSGLVAGFETWVLHKLFGDPIALFTLVLTISTIGLWIETARMRKAANEGSADMKASVRAARDSAHAANRSARFARSTFTLMQETAERQLRAYIGIHEATIIELTPGQRVRVRFLIKNHGDTPAWELRYWSDLKIGTIDQTSFEPTSFNDEHLVVYPHEGTLVVVRGPTVNDAEIASIRSGATYVFIFGSISYKDAFGKLRNSDYCLVYGGDRYGSHGNTMAYWNQGPHGNHAN